MSGNHEQANKNALNNLDEPPQIVDTGKAAMLAYTNINSGSVENV